MAVLRNLARMHSNTVGAGALTLTTAVTGFLTFALAGVNNGETVSYGIFDYDAAGNLLGTEVGRGVYNALGLTRNVLDSTNGGAALNLAGFEQVFITVLTEDMDHSSGSIANVGTNTHAQIDTHIASVANPHGVTAAQAGAPALVNPSVVGNFVSFSNITGAQQDSGFSSASFEPVLTQGNLTAASPLAFDNTRKVIGGAAQVSLTVSAANKYLYSTAVNTWIEGDITVAGRALIDDPDVATMRTTLGVVAGGAGDIWVEKAGDTMTGALTINVDSAVALLVEQTGVKSNVLVVDTTNSLVGINTAPVVAQQLTIIPNATTTKGLVVKTVASQTANLQEWQNSSGTVLGYIGNESSTYFQSVTRSLATSSVVGGAYLEINNSGSGGTVGLYFNARKSTASGSAGYVRGIYGTSTITGGAGTYTACLGGYLAASFNGTGSVTYLRGNYSFATIGGGNGTVSEAYGIDTYVAISSAATAGATITSGSAIRATINNYKAGTTIGTAYGLNLSAWSNVGTITTSYGIYADRTIDVGATKYFIYSLSTSPSVFTGQVGILADSTKLIVGAGNDASLYYDGTNLIINPKEVGSGYLDVLGDLHATGYLVGATAGVDGSFTTADGKTVTVTKGLITAIV